MESTLPDLCLFLLVPRLRTKVARYAELKDKFEKHEKILHERRQKLDKRAERFRLCTARALEMTNDEEGQTYPARSQHEVMQLSSDRETTSMMRDLSDQRASSSPKAGGQFQSHEESHEEQEQEPGQGHDSQQHDDADRVQQATEHNSAPTRQANTVERVDTMQQHQEDGMAVGEGDESGAEKSGENQQEEGGVEPSVQDQEETDIRRGDAYGDDAASRNEAASAAVAAAS